MKQPKTFYITTPIFYPSGKLHIGHFYTMTIAQALCNFKKLQGYETLSLTGTDEHGEKIQKKALESNLSPQDYVDQQAEYIKGFLEKCEFEFDIFSRTTNLHHKQIVQKIFEDFRAKKLIYKGSYKGWYSINDEEFVPQKNILIEEGKYLHPDSKHELQLVEQPSYFFDFQKFIVWIREVIESNLFGLEIRTQQELLNNFLTNLEDLSISRNNFDWGIKIISDPEHVIYVWLDALFNYITNIGFGSQNDGLYNKFWAQGDERVHVIGKEITRFHCVYWPIFLHALGIKQPTKIIDHGWIVVDKFKMSKSRNNTIDPLQLIEEGFESEVIQYFLLRKSNFAKDMIFEIEQLEIIYNSEIVNTFGNLISRCINLFHKKLETPTHFEEENLDQTEKEFMQKLLVATEDFEREFNNFKTHRALETLVKFAHECNSFFDNKQPWKLENNSKEVKTFLNLALNLIYGIVVMLSVVMPKSAKHYLTILNLPKLSFELIREFGKFNNVFPKPNVIFYKKNE